MMAASARGSGTRALDSSNLKRGCCTSFRAAAFAAAFRRAAEDLRFFGVAFLVAAGFLAVAVGRLAVVCAADDSSGSPSVSTAAKRQIDRMFLNSRALITGNPLRDSLLRQVS